MEEVIYKHETNGEFTGIYAQINTASQDSHIITTNKNLRIWTRKI